MTKPDFVKKAEKLLYFSVGVSVVAGIIIAIQLPGMLRIEGVIVEIIMLSLFYSIGEKRNWARIAFLVLFVTGIIGILVLIRQYIIFWTIAPHIVIFGIIILIMRAIALVFLFQKTSSEWFSPKKISKP